MKSPAVTGLVLPGVPNPGWSCGSHKSILVSGNVGNSKLILTPRCVAFLPPTLYNLVVNVCGILITTKINADYFTLLSL